MDNLAHGVFQEDMLSICSKSLLSEYLADLALIVDSLEEFWIAQSPLAETAGKIGSYQARTVAAAQGTRTKGITAEASCSRPDERQRESGWKAKGRRIVSESGSGA